MSTDDERVVATFDDPHQADRARDRLQAELGDTASVEENAPADVGAVVAFDDERGDSAERQPEVTVAVDVPADLAATEAARLEGYGADAEVIEPVPPNS